VRDLALFSLFGKTPIFSLKKLYHFSTDDSFFFQFFRVAGNVVDDALLGTIEYGLHHLHTPLLLILGHSSVRQFFEFFSCCC